MLVRNTCITLYGIHGPPVSLASQVAAGHGEHAQHVLLELAPGLRPTRPSECASVPLVAQPVARLE